MFFKNNETLLFYVLFLILCMIASVIIICTHRRNMRISNGCYKNGGQDIVFLCGITKEEALHYDFFVKDGRYYIRVKGIKKYNRQGFLTGVFEIKFIYGTKGMYIILSLRKKWHCIYTGIYEIALYEFIICKIGGIPVEAVQ